MWFLSINILRIFFELAASVAFLVGIPTGFRDPTGEIPSGARLIESGHSAHHLGCRRTAASGTFRHLPWCQGFPRKTMGTRGLFNGGNPRTKLR